MPSLLHEALVLLFRNRPTLAPELLRDTLGQSLPEYDAVEVQDADLSQITPTEYRADLVVLLRAERPVFGIVVEVQLGYDDDKPYSWPLYAAALRARLRCPTCVLVVTPDAAIARWANRPIDTGQPASPFWPLVLGPSAVPLVTDVDTARRAPELAVLSAQAHGHDPRAFEVATAALEAVAELVDDRGVLYCDLILHALNDSARRAWEALMQTRAYTYQSSFARKYVAEGEAKGEARGEARGRAEGEAKALLTILAARGLEVSEDQRQTILQCTDIALLDTWLQSAVHATCTADVLRPR